MPLLDLVIGLGANLGDPVVALLSARRRLAECWRCTAASHVYRTAPIGPEQPDFFNAALRGECDATPDGMLEQLLMLERELGRVRGLRWGPRVIDLDVLWIAGLSVHTPTLRVPHPRLHERAFALVPLLDVAPDAADPTSGVPYARLLDGVSAQRVDRYVEPRWEAVLRAQRSGIAPAVE